MPLSSYSPSTVRSEKSRNDQSPGEGLVLLLVKIIGSTSFPIAMTVPLFCILVSGYIYTSTPASIERVTSVETSTLASTM